MGRPRSLLAGKENYGIPVRHSSDDIPPRANSRTAKIAFEDPTTCNRFREFDYAPLAFEAVPQPIKKAPRVSRSRFRPVGRLPVDLDAARFGV